MESAELTESQRLIVEVCDEVKELLLVKNRKYGDSALRPRRIFSKASPVEQILVRLDDKIARIATSGMSVDGEGVVDEDTVLDLMGYLVLLRVAMRMQLRDKR